MAKKKPPQHIHPDAPPIVRCADCRHFRRDTSGPSRNIYTHEYFMGVCDAGLHPDSPIKQFADRKRTCVKYRRL